MCVRVCMTDEYLLIMGNNITHIVGIGRLLAPNVGCGAKKMSIMGGLAGIALARRGSE